MLFSVKQNLLTKPKGLEWSDSLYNSSQQFIDLCNQKRACDNIFRKRNSNFKSKGYANERKA